MVVKRMLAKVVMAGVLGSASLAQASVLSFTYKYADGQTFGATVEGTLEANGNIFDVTKVDQVYGNGSPSFADPGQIVLVSGHTVLSLNGTGVNFQVNSSAGGVVLDIQNTASSTYASNTSHVFTFGSNLPNEGYQIFIPTGYSANVVDAPEPATAGLVLAGLLGLGVSRRFRRG